MRRFIKVAIIMTTAGIIFTLTHTPLRRTLISQGTSFQSHSFVSTTPPEPSSLKTRLISICAHDDVQINRASFDLNGDSKKDQVCWEKITLSDATTYFHLIAQVESGEGRIQTAYSLLPVDGSQQIGLCPSPEIQVTTTDWSEEQFSELFDTYNGPVSLTISDGVCDPVWLFWPQENHDTDVLFDFYRM